MYNIEKEQPNFLEELENSKDAVYRSARYLNDLGFPVTINPVLVRPDVELRNAYTDNGDLTASFTFEIKQRPKLHFTGRKDYPFETVIVDVARVFDSRTPPPFRYFIWNDDLSCMISIDVQKTRDKWIKKARFVPHKNIEIVHYECPTELVRFKNF